MSPSTSDLQQKHPKEVDPLQDSPARYLAYVGRFTRVLARLPRIMAYTSEVGEAFRPVVPKPIVTTAYGISWAYIFADVIIGAHNSYERGDRPGIIMRVIAERSVFQSVASMLLPAFAVHQTVHRVDHEFTRRIKLADAAKEAKSGAVVPKKLWVPTPAIARWGPTSAGLALIPFLPVMFDHPVEWLVEKSFDIVWPVKEHFDEVMDSDTLPKPASKEK
ncbi:mitochondrial 18 KDa protein-domain-containing protein [Cladochytrium replicatum]|nr:mitochondrial 18 KDa protein-domain-containing protein [Cladochytrium replicatum]